MATLDTGCQVRIERTALQARGVPIDATPTRSGDDVAEHRVAVDDGRIVHDLGNADGAHLVDDLLHVGRSEGGSRTFERRRRHARRRGDTEREGHLLGRIDHRSNAFEARDVGDFVWVGGHRGRSVRQHGLHIFAHPQLRRLEVHVGIDEAGHQCRPIDVDHLDRVAITPAHNGSVTDREAGGHPLFRCGRQHPATTNQQVGGLVAARCRESPERNRRARHVETLLQWVDVQPR